MSFLAETHFFELKGAFLDPLFTQELCSKGKEKSAPIMHEEVLVCFWQDEPPHFQMTFPKVWSHLSYCFVHIWTQFGQEGHGSKVIERGLAYAVPQGYFGQSTLLFNCHYLCTASGGMGLGNV
jgi:hypothetical protein